MARVSLAAGWACWTRRRAAGSEVHSSARERTQFARSRSGAWSSSKGRTRKSGPPDDPDRAPPSIGAGPRKKKKPTENVLKKGARSTNAT